MGINLTSDSGINWHDTPSALVVAHPGHELCVYGWLEAARPRVFVLTDGSGRSGEPRLGSTTTVLESVGAVPGSIYGRLTDGEIYAAILAGDFGLFERLVAELAAALVREGIESVAGDACEGYNPVHDTCRLVIDAAAELAGRWSGRSIPNRDFLLFGRHDTHPEDLNAGDVLLTLDDDTLSRKLAAARAYPELKHVVNIFLDQQTPEALRSSPALREHFDDAVTSAMGDEAYRVECLRPAGSAYGDRRGADDIPFYEHYGEMLVAAGVYERAIRRRTHLAPLAEAVWRFVEAKS